MWRNYLKATTVDPEALAVRTKEILEAHVTISQPDITSSTTTLQKVTTATATASSLETPGPPIPQAATSTVTAA
jgi:hypothetical protein